MQFLDKLKGLLGHRGGKTGLDTGPDLEEVWRHREEDIYPSLFGQPSRGIFTLSQDVFARHFGCEDVDPTWLFYGVSEFAPTPERASWLYVTSGHSNPWGDDPADYPSNTLSGYGVEFMIATNESADWAIELLQTMLAYDLLLRAGHFEGRSALSVDARIPLASPSEDAEDNDLHSVIVVTPAGLPREFRLPSGQVELLTFVGITSAEMAFARDNGSEALISRLEAQAGYPVTDPNRTSVA